MNKSVYDYYYDISEIIDTALNELDPDNFRLLLRHIMDLLDEYE